jgi:formamidopyrimidine-DNA glycosylase
MPEGPEVKVMTHNIRYLIGDLPCMLLKIHVEPSFLKRCVNIDKFTPTEVTAINCKGKFTYLELKDGNAIGITYGMTGNIRDGPTGDPKQDRHLVVKFVHANGAFYYHSTRHFGHLTFLSSTELNAKLNSLGPDILDEVPLNLDQVVKIWRRKPTANICRVLLEDQHLICGIGNYIKSEIMYRARVYPFSTVNSLTDETLFELYLEARNVANEAFEDGGASLYTYTDLTGDKSALTFKCKLQVYGRPVDPEGNTIETVETPDKRTTHWVPTLQTRGSVRGETPIKLTLRAKPKI